MEAKVKFKRRLLWLIFLTAGAVIVTFTLQPVPQSAAYHDFADKRRLLGVPNCLNVITNLAFLITGIIGLLQLNKSSGGSKLNIIYTFLFSGIFLTGLGSGYYHWHPDNNTLVFDRIPMTIVFMSLLSATVAESIDLKMGSILLFPLLLVGTGSVLLWHYTELRGAGDLRLYGLVQFYPVLFIPFILLAFPSATPVNNGWRQLALAVVWYITAKFCERYDQQIYAVTHLISGHSLKHLAAAISTWYLVELFMKKHVDAV